MAARIEVVVGPDRGWKYTLVGAEARIGRGAGSQVRLTDPGLADGHLRVHQRQGVYLVVNELAHSVLVDGRPLAPAASRALRDRTTVQPTRGTLLRVTVVAAPPGAAAGAVVVAEAPPPKPKSFTSRVLTPAVVALAIGVTAYNEFRPAPRFDPAVSTPHKSALVEVGANNPAVAIKVAGVQKVLTDAVYAEAAGERRTAYARYLEVRDGLTAVRRGADGPAAGGLSADDRTRLADVEGFVNARLVATGRR